MSLDPPVTQASSRVLETGRRKRKKEKRSDEVESADDVPEMASAPEDFSCV